VSNWSLAKLRQYIPYQAKAASIAVKLVDEQHTSQTCRNCAARHNPQGMAPGLSGLRFRSPSRRMGRREHSFAAAIQRSRPYRAAPCGETKYHHLFCNRRTGKRSRLDTAEMACGSLALETQEAAPLSGQPSVTSFKISLSQ